MATPAYTALDVTKPAIGNARSTDIAALLANTIDLRDGIIMGRISGWTLTTASNVEEPAWRKWANGAYALRATYTYTAGYVTNVVWQWSNDPSATWATIATETATYTSTHQTGGANSSLLSWLYEWIGKFKDLRTLYTAHAAATGTAAHGLGTMSTQAASAVAITGGAFNGTVGATTPAEGLFTRACEQYNNYTPGSGAGVALDWTKGGSNLTSNGANTLSFTNVPASRIATHALYCTVFNGATFPAAVTWGLGGKPSIAGKAVVSFVTYDGGTTVFAGIVWREN